MTAHTTDEPVSSCKACARPPRQAAIRGTLGLSKSALYCRHQCREGREAFQERRAMPFMLIPTLQVSDSLDMFPHAMPWACAYEHCRGAAFSVLYSRL